MYRKTLIGAAAAAVLALSGTGYAVATDGAEDPQAGGPTGASTSTLPGVSKCNGGVQKQSLTKIGRNYSTFGEGSDFAVPGMSVSVKGPSHGKDTLNIAFSAETQLRNASAADYYDWMELEVHVDGVPIQPFGPSSDPLAFGGNREYGSNAAQFCTKIGPGTHQVTVVSRLVDNGSDDSLMGWIDDTTLHVVKSN